MEPHATRRNEADIIAQGLAWQQDGADVVLATVAHTWGSSPRPMGAVMALTADGRFVGSVSGGCIEEELIARVRDDFPRAFTILEYASDTHRSLPCGGRLLLTLEPLAAVSGLEAFLAQLDDGRRVLREIDLNNGAASWREAPLDARTSREGERLAVVYEPVWRLVIIGAGELAQWVCRFACLLDYAVEVCEPRPEYRDTWPLDDVVVASEHPDDYLETRPLNEQGAIVALTHDPKVDDLALIAALEGPAFYVGALGSRRTTAKRAERLAEHFGIDGPTLSRIHGPIGIDLNSRRPQEIALAVLADITAVRNGVEITTERKGV